MVLAVTTLPFCGGCGNDLRTDDNTDVFCDSCGADINKTSGQVGLLPPGKTGLSATPGTGDVDFAWVFNDFADSDETSISDDGALAVWSAFAADTSPTTITETTGTLVGIRIRSVLGAEEGPFQEMSAKTG